jgi:hypothetical protein
LVADIIGALILFGFAVDRKIDFDRGTTGAAGAELVESIGSTPAADAKNLRLLEAGRREIRDAFGVAGGYTKEIRGSDADVADINEIESWEARWKVVTVDAIEEWEVGRQPSDSPEMILLRAGPLGKSQRSLALHYLLRAETSEWTMWVTEEPLQKKRTWQGAAS